MAVSTLHPESAPAIRSIADIADQDLGLHINALRALMKAIDDSMADIERHVGLPKDALEATGRIWHYRQMAVRELDDLERTARAIFDLSHTTAVGEAA